MRTHGHFGAWLLMTGAVVVALLLTLVWTVASIRAPEDPAQAGEERDIGFFDPHVHIQLMEVIELSSLPERRAQLRGRRLLAVRLQARSSAVEIFGDPSRLSVTVRDRGGRVLPVSGDLAEIDGIEVRSRFHDLLAAGEVQQSWFVFELPTDLDSPEIWVSRDSWLARNLVGWESSPLHDKAVFALDLGGVAESGE